MGSRTGLAIAIAAWTLLTWGGRIRLLTDADQESLGNWIRIGGSLVVGVVAVVILLTSARTTLERVVLTVFAVWSLGLWLRSLVSVWAGDSSLTFKAVHTALAAGFFVLSYLAVRIAWWDGTD